MLHIRIQSCKEKRPKIVTSFGFNVERHHTSCIPTKRNIGTECIPTTMKYCWSGDMLKGQCMLVHLPVPSLWVCYSYGNWHKRDFKIVMNFILFIYDPHIFPLFSFRRYICVASVCLAWTKDAEWRLKWHNWVWRHEKCILISSSERFCSIQFHPQSNRCHEFRK